MVIVSVVVINIYYATINVIVAIAENLIMVFIDSSQIVVNSNLKQINKIVFDVLIYYSIVVEI